MDEDERCGGSGEDRISVLPDELLHDILVRLRSAHAAARTSVLSRRWRHIWAHLPGLHFVAPRAAAAASFLDAVDGALAGYLAPTLGHLSIFLQQRDDSVTAGRVAPWLRFAAEHMAAGLFTALTFLSLSGGRMEGIKLTSLVCRQCPCLRDLSLFMELIAVSDVSMHSDSLRLLMLHVRNSRRLEVVAPNLEELTVYYQPVESRISAPKLSRLVWDADAYNPHLHQFADVASSLRVLEIHKSSAVPFLTKQFDEVDELKLGVRISQGVAGYESFLNETNKLPKCKSIRIFLTWGDHALVPSMLHLLKRCSSTKKVSVRLLGSNKNPLWGHSCSPSCPCRFEENHKIDVIALSSLEEIEINEFTDSLENMELEEFLSSNAASLKRLVINYTMLFPAPPLTNEVCEKVRGICRANVEVKFNAFRGGKLVPFD